jgi:hypothetical protein
MIVALDDVLADHASLLLAAGVVGAVQRKVPLRGELLAVDTYLRTSDSSFVSVVPLVGNQGPFQEGPAGSSASGYVEVRRCSR